MAPVIISVEGHATELTFSMRIVNCDVDPVIISAIPSSGTSSGGSTITVRVANVRARDVSSISVYFGVGATAVESRITSAATDSASLLLATLTTPPMDITGLSSATIYIGRSSVTFPFLVSQPCDYISYCSQLGLSHNPQAMKDDPPSDSTCSSADYCIDPALVPYPMIASFAPSAGSTAGGVVVTLQVHQLSCMSISDVTVSHHFPPKILQPLPPSFSTLKHSPS